MKKIGHITSTHGLKGEVKVFLLTDKIEDWFSQGKKIYIFDGSSYKEETISSFYMVPQGVGLMKLTGLERIEDVESLLKKDIYGEKIEYKDRIYLGELIGYEVFTLQNKDLGQVKSIQSISGKNYLLVGQALLPYVADEIVVSICKEEKKITVSSLGEEIILNA